MSSEPRNDTRCIKCGGPLSRPAPKAQFECEGCGAVVAPDNLRDYRSL